MSQVKHRQILPGELLQIYKATEYARVSVGISAGGAVNSFIGVKSTIPPVGISDAWQGAGEFGIAPGDELWAGNVAGAPFLGLDVVISPLPWPIKKYPIKSQVFSWATVPTLAVNPTATRLFAADYWCEVTLSTRIADAGAGLISFQSSMQDAYNLAVATPIKIIMKPGDQLFGVASAAAVVNNFQLIVSPAPWWEKGEINLAFLI